MNTHDPLTTLTSSRAMPQRYGLLSREELIQMVAREIRGAWQGSDAAVDAALVAAFATLAPDVPKPVDDFNT